MSETISKLLSGLERRRVASSAILRALKRMPYEDLGFAKVDSHRSLRRGFPEVIFGAGKTADEIVRIAKSILSHDGILLITRTDKTVFRRIKKFCPDARFAEKAKAVYYRKDKPFLKKRTVLIITAGTADIPTAEEAKVTLELMGSRVETLYDVGVAGLHRVLDKRDLMEAAGVIIVVAGMEGALASVVSGLVSKPVVAVPTSVGYGASFRGIAPLLTMMNSCSPGIAVVNIDNGFGAGYFAGMINK
jgi:NCAIR mutase (PurE)-related protein